MRRSVVAACHCLLSTTAVSTYLRPQSSLARVHYGASRSSTLLSSTDRSSFSSKTSTTMAASTKPTYDVVVFGATSFAGSLVAEYYLTNYGASPPAFKWAMAGRSETKLTVVKNRLASEVDESASTIPTIIADCMDDEAIERMVSQAKVVLTTVGPYNLYGSKLVAACARAGVHCCDLTGESLWVKDMVDAHHAEAKQTGAKIVSSCGFDSIPADMGTLMMADHMKRVHGVYPDDVRYFFSENQGGISGGTVASILDMCEQLWTGGKAIMKKVNDPLLLAIPPSDGGVAFKKAGSPGGFGYDSLEKSWTAMSAFASHDSKVVYRSGSILGYPENFRYKEVFSCKGLFKGFFPAVITSAVLAIGGVLLFLPLTRKLVARFLPAPGEGPSKEDRDNGYFWINYTAKANVDGKEVVCRGKVGSDKGDCGYKETSKMLGECGLCLALDEDRLENKGGGLLTTATAMGMPLIERLRAAGMTFKVLDE